MWIDPINKLILESEVTTRNSGTLKLNILAEQIKTLVSPPPYYLLWMLKTSKCQRVFLLIHTKAPLKKQRQKQGKILLNISNYQINKGIPDSFFKKIKGFTNFNRFKKTKSMNRKFLKQSAMLTVGLVIVPSIAISKRNSLLKTISPFQVLIFTSRNPLWIFCISKCY